MASVEKGREARVREQWATTQVKEGMEGKEGKNAARERRRGTATLGMTRVPDVVGRGARQGSCMLEVRTASSTGVCTYVCTYTREPQAVDEARYSDKVTRSGRRQRCVASLP
jgi:hypothetical protein